MHKQRIMPVNPGATALQARNFSLSPANRKGPSATPKMFLMDVKEEYSIIRKEKNDD